MMKTGSRFLLLTVTLLMVFIFSAMLTVPAYADDSTPPPTETPTEVTPPVDESTPAAIDPAPVTEETVPAEETVAELLTQVPEGTDLAVVNDEGETIPLVTQAAADVIEHGDPVWCPTGVAPKTDGTGGCTTSYGSLKLLVDNLMAGTAGVVPAKNGVIWIESGPDASAGAILLDGNDPQLGTMETFTLTLQGGWSGVHGSSSVSLLTPSTFTQSLSIINWLGDITLNNLTFSGVTVSSSSHSAALNVQTSKKITLTNVKVNNNSGAGINGAWLDNSTADSAQSVTIVTGTNEFNNNGGTGLTINSKGAITLKDMTANDNDSDGLFADNHLAATAQPVTLTGINIFIQNGADGLEVISRGAISASYLLANSNVDGWGAKLDNSSATTAQPVKLTGLNEFKYNGWYDLPATDLGGGLWIKSQGAITTANVTAFSGISGAFPSYVGQNDGVRLWNNYNFASNVTMNGTNVFMNNYNDGLEVLSNGVITLNNVKANENGISGSNGFGATLDNSSSATPMAVILNGTNTFNGNYSGGLKILSKGTVTLSKVTASGNTHGNGALINNNYGSTSAPQNVTLTIANVFNDNNGSGLFINSYGMITIANLTANNNGLGAGDDFGAFLNNAGGILPKAVTLTGSNTFNGNTGAGLKITSLGAITLNNVKAESNLGTGAFGYGVNINNQLTGAVGRVSITGYGAFNFNDNTGLTVTTRGAITLSNITATDNHNAANTAGGSGVKLDNTASTSAFPQNVTINGTNAFSGNYYSGLEVDTYGMITINSMTASNNTHGFGADLYNVNGAVPKTVTLNGTNTFNANQSGGLQITSTGIVKINNLDAGSNTGFGAFLDNDEAGAIGGVSLTGKVFVEDNASYGLQVFSRGAITVANLNTFSNGGVGAYLKNNTGAGGVTITGTNQIYENTGDGLKIETKGAVILGNLYVQGNVLGVVINNQDSGPVTPQKVTLTGSNYFYNNGDDGLRISTYGLILLNNIDARGNGGYGAWLDNCGYIGSSCTSTGAPKGITLTGLNFFQNNAKDGLWAVSLGAITISNLTATWNNGNGAYLNNQWTSAAGGITLTGTNTFEHNTTAGTVYGLKVISHGAVTLSNISASSNYAGVNIYTSSLTTKGVAVTFTGVNTFSNNTKTGLTISSDGQITLSNVTADHNGEYGLYLFNTTSHPIPGGVTMTGINSFNYNAYSGLYINSNGAVILNNITADRNALGGAYGGLIVFTTGSFSLTCGSINNNYYVGWRIEAGGQVTLKGLNGFLNTAPNIITSPFTPITQRTCVPPPPVAVSQPEDDDDGVGAGSVQLPNYERH